MDDDDLSPAAVWLIGLTAIIAIGFLAALIGGPDVFTMIP